MGPEAANLTITVVGVATIYIAGGITQLASVPVIQPTTPGSILSGGGFVGAVGIGGSDSNTVAARDIQLVLNNWFFITGSMNFASRPMTQAKVDPLNGAQVIGRTLIRQSMLPVSFAGALANAGLVTNGTTNFLNANAAVKLQVMPLATAADGTADPFGIWMTCNPTVGSGAGAVFWVCVAEVPGTLTAFVPVTGVTGPLPNQVVRALVMPIPMLIVSASNHTIFASVYVPKWNIAAGNTLVCFPAYTGFDSGAAGPTMGANAGYAILVPDGITQGTSPVQIVMAS